MRSEPLFDASKDYGTYSAADWRKIEKSLGGIIDLDATTVIGKHPYSATDEHDKAMPLREALQNLANYYAAMARLKPVTRTGQIAFMKELQSEHETARKVLSGLDAAATDTVAAVTARLAGIREQIGELENMGSGSSGNAKKLHRKFWAELLDIWLALPIAPEQRSHDDLRISLHTCSAPIFPTETTTEALTAFSKAYFKPRQFRKRARF
jgi:hypothetical protein